MSLSKIPSVWTIIGIAALLYGWMPRIGSVLNWLILGVFIFIEMLWEVGIVGWSAMQWTYFAYAHYSIPIHELSIVPLIVSTVIAAALTWLGVIGFRRRSLFYEDFLKRNSDYYGAEIASLDFDLPDAAATINRWVEQQTKGKIQDLIETPIDSDTVLFLLNAIYFQGDWSEPFDDKRTRDVPFHLPDGSSKEHPVMFQEGEFPYLDGDGFQAVALPYGKNERISMCIFLPDAGKTPDSFYGKLDSAQWDSWMSSFRDSEGAVGIPRFKFEYEASLNDVLKTLGMEIAFDNRAADFSSMRPTPPRLYIGEVKHKSFVEVDERGTEAAAATSVEIKEESAPMDWFSMTADRPFFFSIVDNKTGSILFMGSVTDPLLFNANNCI